MSPLLSRTSGDQQGEFWRRLGLAIWLMFGMAVVVVALLAALLGQVVPSISLAGVSASGLILAISEIRRMAANTTISKSGAYYVTALGGFVMGIIVIPVIGLAIGIALPAARSVLIPVGVIGLVLFLYFCSLARSMVRERRG